MKTPKEKSRYSNYITWFIIGVTSIAASFLIVLVLSLVFSTPSYQERVGQTLPPSAKVLHEGGQYGFDSYYIAVIEFEDEKAKDQIIRAWELTPGEARLVFTDMGPAWWPVERIQTIEQAGEQYGRYEYEGGRWWNLWIDRKNKLLYLEQGSS